jgi:hypothetical protein
MTSVDYRSFRMRWETDGGGDGGTALVMGGSWAIDGAREPEARSTRRMDESCEEEKGGQKRTGRSVYCAAGHVRLGHV